MEIVTTTENYQVAEDGVLEYDLNLNVYFVPKNKIDEIELTIAIK